MAKPIKATPILKGQDAVRFLLKMEANKNKKISKEEIAAVKEGYEKIRQLIKT